MSHFFDTLERQTTLEHGERLPSFLDSHPMSRERAQTTAARARSLTVTPAAPIAATRGAFLRKFENLLVGEDPAQGVFRGQRFLHPGLDLALDFPPGWSAQNTASAVGAVAPPRDALVVLQMQGAPGDPQAAAAKFEQQSGIALQSPSRLSLAGMDAVHALASGNTQSGTVALDLTWIAHPQAVLRLTGMSTQARYPAYAATLSAVARSVAKLSAAERAGIRERRLRVVDARAGETLAALASRSGNVWSPDETAIANSLSRDARLESGRLLKIAVEVPYQPRD
jgi:predicted Zn-dependent protease